MPGRALEEDFLAALLRCCAAALRLPAKDMPAAAAVHASLAVALSDEQPLHVAHQVAKVSTGLHHTACTTRKVAKRMVFESR